MLNRRFFLKACAAMALGIPVSGFAASDGNRRIQSVPRGYIQVALEKQLPPLILFGVALQESSMLFRGMKYRELLPWPWTLNVKRVPKRFESRRAAERELLSNLAQGVTLVDIGPMQVCWHYHKDRFVSERDALDPYTNLRAGADILREEFRTRGNWFAAVGCYHAPKDPARAHAYATSVFRRVGMMNHA